uniref:CysS_0 protein n=1 Tax=Fopius arisanus TaxID=64838 RepID=A0A0C9RNP8_9HYME
MPKNKKRKGYSQLREKNAKLKNGVEATKSSVKKPLKNINGSGEDSRSHTSEDVEIIDRQREIATTASQNHNDVNMNDNDVAYAMKAVDQNMHKLFDRIRYSEDAVSTLPDRSWAIHCTELPVKRIVISEMIMHNIGGSGLEPFYIKQVIE